MKIVIATGGFDPLHSGHINYLRSAANLGDYLYVGLNSDEWLSRKKGRAFMSWDERCAIIENLRMVSRVLKIDDSDGTAADAIRQTRSMFPEAIIIFANGGDRGRSNVPEQEMFFEDSNVYFEFGIGGTWKKNSSSWILNEWKAPKTERPWGHYRVIHELPGMKVKELTVEPGQSLSMQRHHHRSEFWIVGEGQAVINLKDSKKSTSTTIDQHSSLTIKKGKWHQITNPFSTPLKMVEIQYGTECVESDIEREESND